MLDRTALMALGLGQKFAQLPEIFALIERSGDRRILDDMVLACRLKQREQAGASPSSALRTQFEQHIPGVFLGENVPRVSKCARTKSRPMRGISSKLVISPPAISRARSSKSSAARGEARPIKAVSTARGFGKSFRTAAVMIPSVPSEPMKRFLRS